MTASKEVCPFCEIVAGNIQARRIYEDEHVLAVLDISPASPGHLIVMPKKHIRTLADAPIALVTYLASVCKQLSWVALRALHAQGTDIILAQGETAGQHAAHLFFHIIPRRDGDGLQPLSIPQQPFTMQDLSDVKLMLVHGIKQVIEGEQPKGDA